MFLNKKKQLKILFVASEAAPFATAGGLGEVMYSLPRALNSMGNDARLFMPRYLSINQSKFPMQMLVEGLRVPSGEDELICNVKKYISKDGDTTYFLENQEYYEKRSNIYGYTDDPVRWALLSKGAMEFLRRNSDWTPDVIVAADWQGGLIPNYIKSEYKDDPVLSEIATVFSVHNLSYQGMFDHRFISEADYDSGNSPIPAITDPKILKLNFMRRGLMHADIINTVSENYAKEITTPEYGEMLDDLLRERRGRLLGILNGIDYKEKSPEIDPHIEHRYSGKNPEAKLANKKFLQRKFNLHEDSNTMLFGVVSRLTEQKGIDLIIDSADALFRNNNFQMIVLGSGEGRYMSFFKHLKDKYPQNVSTHLSYDRALSSVIMAGVDSILIPSKFEPCGLVQMEAMRYGTIPIVRKTGGLAESVIDYDPEKETGTGIVFEKYDHYAFYGAVIRAIEAYKYKNNWIKLQKRAMAADFSWDISARKYERMFERAIQLHKSSRQED